ncbi:MAG: hypothetical protein IT372_13000, partial [Polyangiaceae bacterium]|nr:hypothetical protein [Polyangiaceae bacterium]
AALPPSPSMRQRASEALARDVRDLAAGCAAFAAAREAADEARYYHSLAAEYLGQPVPRAGEGSESRPPVEPPSAPSPSAAPAAPPPGG